MNKRVRISRINKSVCYLASFLFFTSLINSGFCDPGHPAFFGRMKMFSDTLPGETSQTYLMPYNRIIDGAGTTITFGTELMENHSLDAALFPDHRTVAVEDRYGVALIDGKKEKLIDRLAYKDFPAASALMSVYSGIKVYRINGFPHIFWSASDTRNSYVLEAKWEHDSLTFVNVYQFYAINPAPLALANDVWIQREKGDDYMYVVLNGNNQLEKMRLRDKKIMWDVNTGMAPYGITIADDKAYVTNWAGPVPTDPSKETAGIPYDQVYIKHTTGGTLMGTVSVIDIRSGTVIKEIEVGLHPNAIISNDAGTYVYVANGNSDNVSVISTANDQLIKNISVRLNGSEDNFLGDSPNALALSSDNATLYVANGLDNAIAVISLSAPDATGMIKDSLKGFIPTQAYPGGIVINGNKMFVTNLEGTGARVEVNGAYNSHIQDATVSIINIPNDAELTAYTEKVKKLNLQFRDQMATILPRENAVPRPVPERIGEPSTIKHVVYIIKENRTYDQVLGDMPEGNGEKSLCVFGDSVTPNQHAIARQYGLLDNYDASGKSSAEGHQWTDAAMVTDYIEKNVRAWFRSYPHVQQDALVESDAGFIWNQALDHGRTVRIYGEACVPKFDYKLSWSDIYNQYKAGQPFQFQNITTISRVQPILSQTYPGYDSHKITDQIRADAFIKDWKDYESGNTGPLPDLIIVALPDDHTAGMMPGLPIPRCAVADNDLALGRIIDEITHSKFWDSTAVFVTEDDSQDGWDHVSAYRTTGFIISPWSKPNQVIHTNYNQTCMVRTIEQILGIPPMNKIDATAEPMFDCFDSIQIAKPFDSLANQIPLDELVKPLAMLKGKDRKFALLSMQKQFEHIDGGNDDLMNRIIWYATMGNRKYPSNYASAGKDDD
jgi:YVTN family beta-propeller protein